jgi:hypothetical protein
MPRQKRSEKLFCYIEDQFYDRVVEVANQQDQSMSDYLRDLIIEDLYKKEMITEIDFVQVVHESVNSRLNPVVVAADVA